MERPTKELRKRLREECLLTQLSWMCDDLDRWIEELTLWQNHHRGLVEAAIRYRHAERELASTGTTQFPLAGNELSRQADAIIESRRQADARGKETK